jgi:molybdopterin synthase sulfur carrier subunit
MEILVKVFANLREICGDVTVKVKTDGSKVIDVLDQMIQDYPGLQEEIFTAEKTLKPFVHVYINGKNIIHSEDLHTTVTETDQIALFPPVAGG